MQSFETYRDTFLIMHAVGDSPSLPVERSPDSRRIPRHTIPRPASHECERAESSPLKVLKARPAIVAVPVVSVDRPMMHRFVVVASPSYLERRG